MLLLRLVAALLRSLFLPRSAPRERCSAPPTSRAQPGHQATTSRAVRSDLLGFVSRWSITPRCRAASNPPGTAPRNNAESLPSASSAACATHTGARPHRGRSPPSLAAITCAVPGIEPSRAPFLSESQPDPITDRDQNTKCPIPVSWLALLMTFSVGTAGAAGTRSIVICTVGVV